MLVGLHLMPNVLQGAWWSQSWHHVVAVANNCWTRSFALGYWLCYFSSVFDSDKERKPLQEKDCLKWVCMLPFYPCPSWGQSIFVTVGNYIVSNQLIAGSIMVRHMILILVLSLPLRVYYLMSCTHNALWGVIMNSFDSTISYFGCVSCFWQYLQDLFYWVVCAYLVSTSQSLLSLCRLEWLGCWR
jgi:hypothetical protein